MPAAARLQLSLEMKACAASLFRQLTANQAEQSERTELRVNPSRAVIASHFAGDRFVSGHKAPPIRFVSPQVQMMNAGIGSPAAQEIAPDFQAGRGGVGVADRQLIFTARIFQDAPADARREPRQPRAVFHRDHLARHEWMKDIARELGFPEGEKVFAFAAEQRPRGTTGVLEAAIDELRNKVTLLQFPVWEHMAQSPGCATWRETVSLGVPDMPEYWSAKRTRQEPVTLSAGR